MLTKVYLEGAFGKHYGREWEFVVDSPSEALRMVNANKPGAIAWMKSHARKYAAYEVVVEYEDGRVEHLSEEIYLLNRKMKSIRFVPVLTGSGKAMSWIKVIVGIVMIVYGAYTGNYAMVAQGVMMLAGGVVELMTKAPKNPNLNGGNGYSGKASYAFDGPVNTSLQGSPVPVIYGRMLVGSQVISANITVNEEAV